MEAVRWWVVIGSEKRKLTQEEEQQMAIGGCSTMVEELAVKEGREIEATTAAWGSVGRRLTVHAGAGDAKEYGEKLGEVVTFVGERGRWRRRLYEAVRRWLLDGALGMCE